MARIRIKDLPKNMRISKEEMRKISAGSGLVPRAGTQTGSLSTPSQDQIVIAIIGIIAA